MRVNNQTQKNIKRKKSEDCLRNKECRQNKIETKRKKKQKTIQ